jgi:hypothetical protein
VEKDFVCVVCNGADGLYDPGPMVYQPAPLTPAEREEIQTKVLEAETALVFSSTLAVLQDAGWDIQTINKESGVIQAVTKKRTDALGPSEDWKKAGRTKTDAPKTSDEDKTVINEWTRWEKVTVHIEPWSAGKSRNRISIVKFGVQPAVTYTYPVNALFSPRKEVTVTTPATEDQAVVEDPLVYQRLFTRIETAIKVRHEAQTR